MTSRNPCRTASFSRLFTRGLCRSIPKRNGCQGGRFNSLPRRILDLKQQGFQIERTLCKDAIPEALGYTYDNLWYHVKGNLDASEKVVVKLPGFRGNGGVVISESGLYKLVMRSDKPEAKVFQNWVTKEVLPAIRKDGGYIKGEEKLKTGEMADDEFSTDLMTLPTSLRPSTSASARNATKVSSRF